MHNSSFSIQNSSLLVQKSSFFFTSTHSSDSSSTAVTRNLSETSLGIALWWELLAKVTRVQRRIGPLWRGPHRTVRGESARVIFGPAQELPEISVHVDTFSAATCNHKEIYQSPACIYKDRQHIYTYPARTPCSPPGRWTCSSRTGLRSGRGRRRSSTRSRG